MGDVLARFPGAGLMAVTSADRLNAGWHAARKARRSGDATATSHVERLLAPLDRRARLVTVLDGHPATLSWLGGVNGTPGRSTRRRAFRPNRHHRRPLPTLRHQRQRNHTRMPGQAMTRPTSTTTQAKQSTVVSAGSKAMATMYSAAPLGVLSGTGSRTQSRAGADKQCRRPAARSPCPDLALSLVRQPSRKSWVS